MDVRRRVALPESEIPSACPLIGPVYRFGRRVVPLAADSAFRFAGLCRTASVRLLLRIALRDLRAHRRPERDDDSAGYVSEPVSDRLLVVPLLPFAAMTFPERIPTEIVQLFSSAEAWNYRLVPYARKDGTVL